MSDGLRAIAKDLPLSRLSTTARLVAEQLEAGQSLEAALTSLGPSFPAHVRGMVVAGGRTGGLGRSLDAVLAHERAMDDLSRRLWQAVAYPLLLFAFLAAWLVFVGAWLVPSIEIASVLSEFQSLNQPSGEPTEFGAAAHRLTEFGRIVPPLVLSTLGILLAVVVGCACSAAKRP